MSFLGYKFKILKASQVPYDELPLGEITIYIQDGDVQTAARIAESILVGGNVSGNFQIEADGNAGAVLELDAGVNLDFDFANTEALIATAAKIQTDLQEQVAVDCDIFAYGYRSIEAIVTLTHDFSVVMKVNDVVAFQSDPTIIVTPEAQLITSGRVPFGATGTIQIAVVVGQRQDDAEHMNGDISGAGTIVMIGQLENINPMQGSAVDKVIVDTVLGLLRYTLLADLDSEVLSTEDNKTLEDLRYTAST